MHAEPAVTAPWVVDLRLVEREHVVDGVAGLAPTLPGGPAGWQATAKRAIDVAVALVLLLAVTPLLVLAAIGTKLSDGGPVLFRQVRIGQGGRPFTMLKLRTYPVDHLDLAQSLPHEACPSRWGRLLRRSSLDELPQFVNVLRGDMALVGPRPERPRFATEIAADLPAYRERHRAPVGITGLAQINGLCGPTSLRARVELDNAYVEGWHLGRDLAVLARTVPAVLRKIHW
jgi:lipopolysaccharide/colanic/teichoic acid biosynthesis glycosyltransferase